MGTQVMKYPTVPNVTYFVMIFENQ